MQYYSHFSRRMNADDDMIHREKKKIYILIDFVIETMFDNKTL